MKTRREKIEAILRRHRAVQAALDLLDERYRQVLNLLDSGRLGDNARAMGVTKGRYRIWERVAVDRVADMLLGVDVPVADHGTE